MNGKLLLIHNRYQQAGGEDAVFAAEAAILQQYGHKVVEYTEDNRRINGMSRIAVATRTIWSRSSYQKLLKVLRDVHPDVVHFHNTFLLISPSSYWACREADVPVVQTLHNYRFLCPTATFFRNGRICEDCLSKTPPWPGVLHVCYRHSRSQTAVVALMLSVHRWLKTWKEKVDIYIALTEFSRQKFIEGGLPAEKIVVKPNFVHPDPGVRDNAGDYGLFVGRLSSEKGIHTLLKTWANLRGIPLKIIGDGPLMDEMTTFVQKGRLQEVDLLGRHSHQVAIALLKGARFLVFPSECYEHFPLAIAEAFACGVPVIASRLGAMAEIMEDGRTGLHFNPGVPDDLAAKATWLWSHPAEAEKMGREARAEFEARYTAERNYQMLMQIYETALRSRSRITS